MHQIIHPAEYQNSFLVFFLIGQQENPDMEGELQLEKEKSEYGDIIEYNEVDNYSQGSTKSLDSKRVLERLLSKEKS